MKIRPLNNMVLIRPEKEPDVSPGGIHLPSKAKEPSPYGIVVAKDDNAPYSLEVDDRVLFSRANAAVHQIKGVEHFLVPFTNILAIIEE